MSLRGKAAVVGISWIRPFWHGYPGRDSISLQAEAVAAAIADSGLKKEQINGIIAEPPGDTPGENYPGRLADYLGLKPNFATSVNMIGSSGVVSVIKAASYVSAGYADAIVCVLGGATRGSWARPHPGEQWSTPYGPTTGANGSYALLAQRHKFEYGTTDEQRARVAVMQRFNAQGFPLASFYGEGSSPAGGGPITTEDVLSSRLISDPLHLLECVMPVAGAGACIVTTAERARTLPHIPAYILGAGVYTDHSSILTWDRITESPVRVAGRLAYEMAGVGPKGIDVCELYDCYTITVMIEMEDLGFIPKGEAGPWMEDNDITYKGNLPVNTHGGQLSFGQYHGSGGGFTQVLEGVTQIMGRGGERQVKDAEVCLAVG